MSDGDAITIAIEDSKIAHIHAEKIKAYMEEMFQERFDLNVNVAFDYSEADKEKLRRASALVEQQKIDAILNNLRDHGDIIVDGKAVDKDKLGVSKKEDKKSEGHKSDEKKAAPASSGGDSGQKNGGEKEKFGRRRRYSDDPEVFIGRDVEGKLLEISSINDGIGEVVIHGQIMSTEERELRNGKIILTGYITDFTDTIGFKMFCSPEDMEVYREEIQKGKFYRMKGLAEFDSYAKEVMICRVLGMKHIQDFRVFEKTRRNYGFCWYCLGAASAGDRHCACADHKGSLYVVIYRCRNRSSFIYKFQSGWNDRGNF